MENRKNLKNTNNMEKMKILKNIKEMKNMKIIKNIASYSQLQLAIASGQLVISQTPSLIVLAE